jgi:hypothetical protein
MKITTTESFHYSPAFANSENNLGKVGAYSIGEAITKCDKLISLNLNMT